MSRWTSRGADPSLESFYTTTYSSSYSRPKTMYTRSRGLAAESQAVGSGFASNNHVSPLDLAPLKEKGIYDTTSSHVAFSEGSSVKTLMAKRPLVRATMEHSGFWHEPEPNVLYDSQARRIQAVKERTLNAEGLDPVTLKRMKHYNPIDAENHGAGPSWGSTTAGASYQQHESSYDRYKELDKNLIGKKEQNSYTRQRSMIGEKPIDEQESTMMASYRGPVRKRGIEMPERTVMEPSGFSNSVLPTIGRNVLLSDRNPDDMSPAAISRLKQTDPVEYQNMYDPDAYKSIYQVSYKPDRPMRTRASTAVTGYRIAKSGYNSNETVIAGAPGDARLFKTGKSETMKQYKDPVTVRMKQLKKSTVA